MKNIAIKISKQLHIPIALATIIAIIFIPKIMGIMMITWYLIGLYKAHKLDKKKE